MPVKEPRQPHRPDPGPPDRREQFRIAFEGIRRQADMEPPQGLRFGGKEPLRPRKANQSTGAEGLQGSSASQFHGADYCPTRAAKPRLFVRKKRMS
jgi:hypothetical protein